VIPHNKVCLSQPAADTAAYAVSSGHVGDGSIVARFERALAEEFAAGDEAVCVSSGTAALYLALTVTRSPGASVKIPTYACVSLLHAVTMARMVPVLLDVERDTLHAPDADVMAQTFGLASRPQTRAIEDFTHAPGAMVGDSKCGSLGSCSVISFGATKPLGIGGGGAVIGPNALIREIRDRRDYDTLWPHRPRFNWLMSDILAAVGLARLDTLAAENAWRRDVAARYDEALGISADHSSSTCYRYVVRCADAEKARVKMAERGVECILPVEPRELLHRRLVENCRSWSEAEEAARSLLSVPIWPGMPDSEVSMVASELPRLFRS
jgi:dTDP-4-amino-4,6-dideoxygalactose transaminase